MKPVLTTAAIALAAYAAVYLIQKKAAIAIPLVGQYLPGGTAA